MYLNSCKQHAKIPTRHRQNYKCTKQKRFQYKKINTTAGRLFVRCKRRLPKVEHPKFEGHVTPNEDEYQKFVRKNLDVVLKYQNSPLLFLITCILAEEIAFEIGHFRTFWTSDIDLNLGLGHMVYRRVSIIDLYLHTKFRSNRKNLDDH